MLLLLRSQDLPPGWAPRLRVELALATRPTEVPTWVDVSDAVLPPLTITRGRTHELARFEAGTAKVLLDNNDRRFDPTYAAGPYYGTLKPMRRIRISAIRNGVVSPLFTGYVEAWPPVYDVADGTVTLSCVDGFKALARFGLAGKSYPEQLSSARINAVLDDAGWTTGYTWVLDSATNSQLGTTTILGPYRDRLVMLGNTTVQAETFGADDATNALAHLQDVALTENGLLFVAKDGTMTFYNRHYLYAPAFYASKATFGDADGEVPYSDLTVSYDDSEIANEVRCTRRGSTTQAAADASSKLDYWPILLQQDNLLATTDAEMLDRANVLLLRRKQPSLRVTRLTLDGGDDGQWDQILARELGDRITVRRRPFGGAVLAAEYHIERISIAVDPGWGWGVDWELSPADPTRYWLVSDGSDEFAANAVLGTTTVLAY